MHGALNATTGTGAAATNGRVKPPSISVQSSYALGVTSKLGRLPLAGSEASKHEQCALLRRRPTRCTGRRRETFSAKLPLLGDLLLCEVLGSGGGAAPVSSNAVGRRNGWATNGEDRWMDGSSIFS